MLKYFYEYAIELLEKKFRQLLFFFTTGYAGRFFIFQKIFAFRKRSVRKGF